MLARKGRISIHGDLASWQTRATARFREAPLTHEVVLAAHQLDMHSDPADQFLAATANGLGEIATLANR